MTSQPMQEVPRTWTACELPRCRGRRRRARSRRTGRWGSCRRRGPLYRRPRAAAAEAWPDVGKVRAVVVVATRSGSGGRRLEAKSKRVYREAVGGAVGCGAVTAMWSSEPPSRKDPRRRKEAPLPLLYLPSSASGELVQKSCDPTDHLHGG